jgi:hypothetical protein
LDDSISDEQIEALRDDYKNQTDKNLVASINSLLDIYSYNEVNRALNMMVIRSVEEDRKNLAVKIMRVLPLCKENNRYGYYYNGIMLDSYAMLLMNHWVPDYLVTMDHSEYVFDNDAMENLWNYW